MSKGLEIIKKKKELLNKQNQDDQSVIVWDFELDIIEKELKEYEGAKNHIDALHKERIENSLKLKALEIIKKFVNIDMLMFKGELEQEEYDLLKEVLL